MLALALRVPPRARAVKVASELLCALLGVYDVCETFARTETLTLIPESQGAGKPSPRHASRPSRTTSSRVLWRFSPLLPGNGASLAMLARATQSGTKDSHASSRTVRTRTAASGACLHCFGPPGLHNGPVEWRALLASASHGQLR